MNQSDYNRLTKSYESVVRAKAEKWQEEDDREDLDEEDYIIEAVILEVIPSEEVSSPVELAEIYFECSEYQERDIPMNWRDFPHNPSDPLLENLQMIVDRVVRLDVLDRCGIDMSK